MEGLLINPRIRDEPKHIPYGLCMVSAVLREHGFNATLLDDNIFRLPIEATRETIGKGGWDWVGIGGFSSQYKWIKPLVKCVRELFPDTVVIGGGGFMSSQPEDIMRWLPEVDVGVIGESEHTIIDLVERIDNRRWGEVDGIIHRDGKSTHRTKPRALINNLDELPYPDLGILSLIGAQEFQRFFPGYFHYSKLPLSLRSMQSVKRLDVVAERGCPQACNYCQHLGMSAYDLSVTYGEVVRGPNVRWQSPEYIVKMVKEWRFKYGIDFTAILDENTLTNRPRTEKLCELWQSEGLSDTVGFGLLGDVRCVEPAILRKLAEAGCAYISYGPETFSPRLMKMINKRETPEQVEGAVDETLKMQINPIQTFMWGFPD